MNPYNSRNLEILADSIRKIGLRTIADEMAKDIQGVQNLEERLTVAEASNAELLAALERLYAAANNLHLREELEATLDRADDVIAMARGRKDARP